MFFEFLAGILVVQICEYLWVGPLETRYEPSSLLYTPKRVVIFGESDPVYFDENRVDDPLRGCTLSVYIDKLTDRFSGETGKQKITLAS